MIRALLVTALLFSAQMALAFSYTVEIPEEELQKKVSAMMPIEKKKLFVTVVLSKPEVDLMEGEDKIGVFSHIEVRVPGAAGLKGSGRVNITGSLSYDAKKGAFFFHKPSIVRLEVDKIPGKYMKNVKKAVELIAKKVLATRPVYTLKDDNVKQKLAKSVLETVSVKDQQLEVVLSVF